ncbi:MAG: PHP domain-containing protein, partial [Bacteroidota bacterium]|nr:PHP domain-containing protein [Bacteroidota bacterium]
LDDLENACIEKKLTTIKGFGEKAQAAILEEIEKFKVNKKFLLLSTALRFADDISSKLMRLKISSNFEVTGELRRKCEIISSIEFIVEIIQESDKEKIVAAFELAIEQDLGKNTSLYPVPLKFHFTTAKEYSKKLFITTGSVEFVESLAEKTSGSDYNSEEEIFQAAGFDYIIPEMREIDFFKYGAELQHNSDLELDGYKALLHFHTTYSDGVNSIEEMVLAAKKIGIEYAVVCDHSKTAAYANGLQEDRLAIQGREIKQLAKKLNFTIFRGIESDILGDGSLDFPEEVLRELKFVVASVHSRFNLDEEEQTSRIIKAVENPYTRLLGHPTGRLLLSRDAYKIDIKKIIDACAANKTAIEINASPNRLDLDWRWIYYAREKGCLFAINADAHSTSDIAKTDYGVSVARKAGLLKSEVINYYTLEQFEEFLKLKG